MQNKNTWQIEDEQIITRFRRMCKDGQLIELPKFKGSLKARFIDATHVKKSRHGNVKVILYTVSRSAGVIRTWVPIESVRFQNDGRATAMNTNGRNHTPDKMELLVLRHKQEMTPGYVVAIQQYVDRYKAMVKAGGTSLQNGALYRLLDDLGVNVALAEKNLGNIEALDKVCLEYMQRNPESYRYALYPEYYCGYPS